MIDVIAYNPETHEVVLSIVKERYWDESGQDLFKLQDKINYCLEFVLNGHIKELYPNVKTDGVTIQIDCCFEPDIKTQDFLNAVRANTQPYKIPITVRVKMVEAN